MTTATLLAKAPSASSASMRRLFSPLPTVQSTAVSTKASNMCQVLNIRYELSPLSSSASPGQLLNLYREGRSIAGYETIEQFYGDMATEGWTVESTSKTRGGSLHFAVMKREL